ncbi:hypothetical protein N9L68_02490 [bacterium]|nr:hypothetical protein [bacterium]
MSVPWAPHFGIRLHLETDPITVWVRMLVKPPAILDQPLAQAEQRPYSWEEAERQVKASLPAPDVEALSAAVPYATH